MEQFNSLFGKYNSMFNDKFNYIYTNQYLFGLLILCTIIYCIIVRNQLPDYLDKLLHNNLFIFVAISYTLYRVNDDIKLSVVLTFCFLLIMSLIKKNKYEKFTGTNNSAIKCYESNNNHNTDYCGLTDANAASVQCNYCPDKKDKQACK